MKAKIFYSWLLFLLIGTQADPCTIISGVDKNGAAWAGNNEDYEFDFETYLNVLPAEQHLLGAITFTYDRPDSFIQGGINEAGLFFDYNALLPVSVSDYEGWDKKKDFPGGDNAVNLYILQHCSTTNQVIDLLKEYRLPALLGSQLHVADRNGNLAVIDADGIRAGTSGYQVSTNFNVFSKASSPQAHACWRFPIATKMMKDGGVNLDNFRQILNATQQYRYYGTIYSNIANLSTGDVYFYYAGDFENPYHFQIKELLTKGKQSLLMRTLFPQAPIVKVWNVYQAEGAQQAITEFRRVTDGSSNKRKSEILRHLFQNCLMMTQKFADAKIFFSEWLKVNGGEDPATNFYASFVELANGDYKQAQALMEKQVKIDAQQDLSQPGYPPRAAKYLERIQGKKPPDANAHFDLKGYQDAKFVALYLPDDVPVYYPLQKTSDGWAGDFVLPSGDVYYSFLVDGKIVADPTNPKLEVYTTEAGGMKLNKIAVK
jgi:hypothetical protein